MGVCLIRLRTLISAWNTKRRIELIAYILVLCNLKKQLCIDQLLNSKTLTSGGDSEGKGQFQEALRRIQAY
ncbi:unnamed protein product [Thlaspi arvense]|uniref:Uncharacterized protein n=1 Tax=Thlaspi arvense TaxID=13288 RepID=A0AAU9R7T5_THLAR|nr:unnamed protein product [Thlaspi arvense]